MRSVAFGFANATCAAGTVEYRHVRVEQDEIRFAFPPAFVGSATVLDFDRFEAEVRAQHCEIAAIGLVVVGNQRATDRKSVVWGKSVPVRVDLGGRRTVKKNQYDLKSTRSTSPHCSLRRHK